MKRIKTINRLVEEGIIAIIRTDTKNTALKLIEAIKEGGISSIEVSMTMPEALDIIEEVAKNKSDVLIGAGTVLDPQTARMCILKGAKYIISPSLDEDTIKLCNRYRVPIIPGISSPTEIVKALELGVEILKVFPQSMHGPDIIKIYKGPFPQANFMPTGGVTVENIKDWFSMGAEIVAIGSSLTKLAAQGDYEMVTKKAKELVKKVKKYKAK